MSRQHEDRIEHLLEVIATNTHLIVDGLVYLTIILTPPQAVTARVSTLKSGGNMTTAIATFVDQNDRPIAPPNGDGSGITVTFSSDNPAVTIGAASASGDTAVATITGIEAFNLSTVVANTSGAPLLDNDGVTEFVQPATVAVAATTVPDQAVTAVVTTE